MAIVESDFYLLHDDNLNKLYVVFCDLSHEPGAAWALVMSWVTEKYRELPNFKNMTFLDDAPINENTPNWNIYRQTWARMNSIRQHSTHWRATCDFQFASTRIDFLDYLRGKFSDVDIMTWQGGGSDCQPVEYVNILGRTGGSGTTVGLWQSSGSYLLHIDSSHTGCEFLPCVFIQHGCVHALKCSEWPCHPHLGHFAL